MNDYNKIFKEARFDVADGGFKESLMARISALPEPQKPLIEQFELDKPSRKRFIIQTVITTAACAVGVLLISSNIMTYYTALTTSAHNLLSQIINIP